MKKLNNLFSYLIVIAAALSLSSCASSLRDKVSLDGYNNLELMGFSGVKADLTFSNESRRNVHLNTVVATITEGGKQIATLELKDPIKIPRRSSEEAIPTIWQLTNVNMLSALSASKKLLNGEGLDSFYTDIDAQVRVSFIKKNYQYRNKSLKSLLNKL